MKIATWNVERLKHHKYLETMLQEITNIGADILVLTETDERLRPDYPYYVHTPMLHATRPDFYRKTENRVSVFSRYKCVKQHETYDENTAICVELETERGNLLVYGTIMGIRGNRDVTFKSDLIKQMNDIRRLSAQQNPLCVIGDYNLSFFDNYYFTQEGRDLVEHTFRDCGLDILTGTIPECVDHIAVTKGFISADMISEWNTEKVLSDHKGIVIEADTLLEERLRGTI